MAPKRKAEASAASDTKAKATKKRQKIKPRPAEVAKKPPRRPVEKRNSFMAEEQVGVYPGTFDPITNGHLDIIIRAAKVVDPTSQPAGRTASMPGSRLQRSGWLPCATQAAMAADCGLITGLSYGCQRCSSCEQPGSRSLRPPPRRAPAERAGASRGLTGAPQYLQTVRAGPSNPPYRPISCPIRPVPCPSPARSPAR